MSKEIKDYLHLYLGRQVEVMPAQAKSYVGQLQQIDVNGYCIVADMSITRHTHIDYIKPFLRDLSDMSEEEDEEFRKVNRDNWIDMHWYPEGFTWLISKGFDLFGLIPAKLAINAKDLKQ